MFSFIRVDSLFLLVARWMFVGLESNWPSGGLGYSIPQHRVHYRYGGGNLAVCLEPSGRVDAAPTRSHEPMAGQSRRPLPSRSLRAGDVCDAAGNAVFGAVFRHCGRVCSRGRHTTTAGNFHRSGPGYGTTMADSGGPAPIGDVSAQARALDVHYAGRVWDHAATDQRLAVESVGALMGRIDSGGNRRLVGQDHPGPDRSALRWQGTGCNPLHRNTGD